MKYSISRLLKSSDASITIDESEVIEGFREIGHEYEFENPVNFKGTLVNHNGVLKLDGLLKVKYNAKCYRCLKNLEQNLQIKVSELFVNQHAKTDDELYTYDEDYIDIDRALMDNIFLNLPMRQLCSEDCKGLCQKCGGNLNKITCQCNEDTINPLMEDLKKFYED